MVAHPDPAVLYPDVAARGSLGAALQAVAEEGGFSVPVTASTSDPLRSAVVHSTLPHRRPLCISSSATERQWSIRGEGSIAYAPLVQGDTGDLAQVARAARAWLDGTSLSDMRRAAPFVHLTGRFEVPDHDPVRLTESQWQGLRTEASAGGSPGFHALVEAACAEPALRSLYPFTSHWALRFSTTTGPFTTIVGPCLIADDIDHYTVSMAFTGRDPLAETTTAREAVAVAVRHLPSGLGPVTSGEFPAEDRRDLGGLGV